MGLLDRFKKKKESVDIDEEFAKLGGGFPTPGQESAPYGEFKTDIGSAAESVTPISLRDTSFEPVPPLQKRPQMDLGRDLELISLKLDAVKAQLDALTEKVNALGRMFERKKQW